MKRIDPKLTLAEWEAVATELYAGISQTEENPGPYHSSHHAAKRALAKVREALAEFQKENA